jgi:enoyl-CoA hydratase
MPVILTDVADFVATVALNRPGRRNALSAELIADLRRALTDLDARPDVRVIVLTGADPAFCAGLDLTELGQADSPLRGVARGPVIPDLAGPLIGAINGVAVTGGLELALACDFLVASERAQFADTHARVGIQPGWGLTVALPEAVGLRRAREMSATGNFIDAHTALAWGLVNHVVAHGELLPFAHRLAAAAAATATATATATDQDALRAIYGTYDEGSKRTRRDALRLEAEVNARWHAQGIDSGQVTRRRAAVIERGRAQR